MELAPYSDFIITGYIKTEQVVKASKGHIPQPFLISKLKKNCGKDNSEYF
jgi:hypothetical protein